MTPKQQLKIVRKEIAQLTKILPVVAEAYDDTEIREQLSYLKIQEMLLEAA